MQESLPPPCKSYHYLHIAGYFWPPLQGAISANNQDTLAGDPTSLLENQRRCCHRGFQPIFDGPLRAGDGPDGLIRAGDGPDGVLNAGDGPDCVLRAGDGPDGLLRAGDGPDGFLRAGDGPDGLVRSSCDFSVFHLLFTFFATRRVAQ